MSRAELSDVNEVLRQALAIARKEPRKAVELLESALGRARIKSDTPGIALLARHAGVISMELDELCRARSYFEEALVADGQDAYLHLASADVLQRLGERDAARSALTRVLTLATEQDDAEMIDVATQALARLDEEARGC